jgi:hypothetical protein
MQVHRYAAGGGREHRHRGGLCGAHDARDVEVGEHSLDGDGVGVVAPDPGVDVPLQREQPLRGRQRRRRAEHVDVDHPQLAAGSALDHGDAAPGQSGVDPEDAHHPHTSLAAASREPSR